LQRITITIDDDLLEAVDDLVRRRGHDSRSNALREIVRGHVSRKAAEADDGPCIAALSCVYDHATRDLAARITDALHARHDLTVSSLHVHLDHASCLEVSVIRGPAAAVRRLAEEVTGQRGVRHANLHLVPVEEAAAEHDHGHGSPPHRHIRA
jgi:CopG family nickel-responsive transcriptional regulator